jgi:exonuclease VII large subunit
MAFYDFRFERINLSSEMEIINALRRYSNDAGILVISRGGGENMEVFNKHSLAEEAIKLKCPFLTAIGHKQDTSLLQKVADKSFITPNELGQYFNSIYNQTIEELQNSKAKLVNDISKQIDASYQIQIKSLSEQLEGNKSLSEQQLQSANEQMNDYKTRLEKRKSMAVVMWVLMVVACVIGILIGRGCNF